tara:strand:+ start:4585 stop:4809 length:225 start_codon:yes stop_codon:yes gene_type:complete
MKKIILGVVFVFASITMVNANTNTNDKVDGRCSNFAMEVFYEATDQGMSYEDAYDLSNDAENICKALNFLSAQM